MRLSERTLKRRKRRERRDSVRNPTSVQGSLVGHSRTSMLTETGVHMRSALLTPNSTRISNVTVYYLWAVTEAVRRI